MKVQLRREKHQPDKDCTLGLLFVPNVLSLVTIELPWIPSPNPDDRGGLKFKSCVPVGTYQLVRHDSPKHPKTWCLVNPELDVLHYEGDDRDPDEDRTTSLLHVANYVNELQACIGVGTRTAKAPPGKGSGYMVCDSQTAMGLLRTHLPWVDGHTLDISETT